MSSLYSRQDLNEQENHDGGQGKGKRARAKGQKPQTVISPTPLRRFLALPLPAPPRPVKKIASPSIPGSPTTTTAGGEATGQDKSSAAGIFVPTVEHVHGGGGVLVFVVVLALALALIWCCARRRLSWGCMADRVGGFLLRKVFDIRCACSQVVLIASLVSENILFPL